MMSETATTAGRIAESLGERIISGALQPDAPLRQDHIAREFNSSHVPVREAFRRLEAQHLVVAVPRRGVRVAPLDANSVKEIAEMRAALEVVALRNAAPKLTPAHLARLELALIEGDNTETIQDFEAANRPSIMRWWRPARCRTCSPASTDCSSPIPVWCSRPRIAPAGSRGPIRITG